MRKPFWEKVKIHRQNGMEVQGAGFLSAKHGRWGLSGPGAEAGLVRMLCLMAVVFFQAMDKEGRNLTYTLGLSGSMDSIATFG